MSALDKVQAESEAVRREIELRERVMRHWPEIEQLLKDSGEVGHQIGYHDLTGDGEVTADCEAGCTCCRAVELLDKLKA